MLQLLLAAPAFGQAPGLLWTTNVGATLFAVDGNTNVYANAGGSVIVINASGTPLQTNAICPVPGLAQRDATGNFYFGGNFDGTQNFGGITLIGGWTNWPTPGHWTSGYPTHFVAKYDAVGALQWVNSFGNQAESYNRLTDILVDSTGAVYAGYLTLMISPGGGFITRLSNTGAIQWNQAMGGILMNSVKLGGLTASNCNFILNNGIDVIPMRVSTSGTVSGVVPAMGGSRARPSTRQTPSRS